MSIRRRNRLAVAAFIVSGVLWGAGFPFGKYAFAQLGPAHVVLFRFVMATAVMVPIAWAQGVRPARRDLPLFVVAGVVTVPVTYLLQFAGLTLTTAASASLVMGATPPLLALAAVATRGERLGVGGWIAVALSSVGVLLVVGQPNGGHSWVGDFLVFLAAVAVVGAVLMTKDLVGRYPALAATTYIIAFGTITLAPVALLWEGLPSLHLSAQVWGSVLLLGLGSTALANLLYNWGLAHFDASRAGVYLNVEPLVGALLGVTMLGEQLGPSAALGGALIVGTALYISRTQ